MGEDTEGGCVQVGADKLSQHGLLYPQRVVVAAVCLTAAQRVGQSKLFLRSLLHVALTCFLGGPRTVVLQNSLKYALMPLSICGRCASPELNPKHTKNPQARRMISASWAKCEVCRPQILRTLEAVGLPDPLEIRILVFALGLNNDLMRKF